MMKAKLWMVFITACLALAACTGTSGRNPAPLPTVVLGEDGTPAATTSAPGTTQSSSGVTASGILVADEQVNLAFTIAGRVKSVHFQVGDRVKAGDILVELEDDTLKLQLEQAALALNELTSPGAIARAQKVVAEDQSALNGAQGNLNWWLNTVYNQGLLEKAQADLIIAQGKYDDAKEAYEDTHGDLTDEKKAAAYQRMYDAEQALKQAQSKYDLFLRADPYQLEIDRATVEVAKAQLAEDQTLLAALTGGELPELPSGSGYARLQQARLTLAQAQLALDAVRLVSPFDGVIAVVNLAAGDFVQPGQTQVVVLTPEQLHVETTDLSERDVPAVQVGQEVSITIKPLNELVNGVVSAISPLSETLGGDVVYRVFIAIDELPKGALSGMSVVVIFH
jgi:HlyD family secretion protein